MSARESHHHMLHGFEPATLPQPVSASPARSADAGVRQVRTCWGPSKAASPVYRTPVRPRMPEGGAEGDNEVAHPRLSWDGSDCVGRCREPCRSAEAEARRRATAEDRDADATCGSSADKSRSVLGIGNGHLRPVVGGINHSGLPWLRPVPGGHGFFRQPRPLGRWACASMPCTSSTRVPSTRSADARTVRATGVTQPKRHLAPSSRRARPRTTRSGASSSIRRARTLLVRSRSPSRSTTPRFTPESTPRRRRCAVMSP
jgi:hypothetical protein